MAMKPNSSSTRIVITGLLACGASWVGTAAAHAQAGAPAPGGEAQAGLADIVVTARRVEESQQQVPIAVTTITSEALQQRNVRTVSDIQYSVPNLQIAPSANYASVPEFIIRGQRQQLFTDENVVTYLNDVPVSTRALLLYDIDNVQALKGPQGTLFGKNSLGGAMVISTKNPVFDLEGMMELEVGNYNRMQATGVINLPLAQDVAALRIAGRVERRDGVYRNSFPGTKDMDDRNNESVRATLLLSPGDRFENLTTVDFIHRDEIQPPRVMEAASVSGTGLFDLARQGVTLQSQEGGAQPVLDGALLVRAGTPFRVSMPTGIGRTSALGGGSVLNTNGTYVKTYGVANKTSFRLNDALTIRNIFGYRYEKAIDEQTPSGFSGYTLDLRPVLGPNAGTGQTALNTTNYLNTFKTITNELQLFGELANLKFIVGGFYSHQKTGYDVNSYLAVGPVSFRPRPTRHADMRQTFTSKAIFAQGTYDFGSVGLEGLSLTLGGRYTWDKKSAFNENFYSNINDLKQDWPVANGVCNTIAGTSNGVTAVNSATACNLTGSKSWKAATYTASLDYRLSPRTMVYAATRRGYKAGGTNPTTVTNSFVFFDPEKLTDYEIGLKHDGTLGTVPYRLNIAGFIGKYRDIQTQSILSFCSDATQPSATCPIRYTDLILVNVGKATIKGVEVEATVKPVPAVQLDVGYAYQVGRYGSGSFIPAPANPGPIANDNPVNLSGGFPLRGVEFTGIPRHTLTVAASADLSFIPESLAKTSVSMNYAYRSKTKGLPQLGVMGAPGFGLLNGRVSFADIGGTPISMALWMQNIANKTYRLACTDNISSLGFATCRWGDPRLYGITGSVKF
jgi:iron complex outermembrane receptor protein